ncbi:MAG: TatD family hydrolase [Candidatus Eremiobacteraeota bacterium]|nr:TatD family hydrolase [Candidatus Eremiobacteraeota bacterium]
MFDTHAHIHDPAFDIDRDDMLARARGAGVDRIMAIGTDLADSRRAQTVAHRYGLAYAIGIHPHEAEGAPDDIAAAFDAIVAEGTTPPRAIGEMGLDYFYNHSPKAAQQRVLIAQLRYARERGIPAVFHQRDAFDDFIDILRAEGGEPVTGVVHCFTGTPAEAKTLVEEFGLHLGIGGVATFKNAQNVRDAVVAVGLDRIVLETDCPYLAPVPHRGSRNEPAFIVATAARLADLFSIATAELAARTSATARALFGD